MAENTGKTKGALISAVKSAQTAVGSMLTGGSMAMSMPTSGGNPEDTLLLEDLREIGKENEKNTEKMVNIFGAMFAWDKEKFRRERDQLREKNKEALKSGPSEAIQMPTLEEATGGFGLKGMAALTALVAVLNAPDVLRMGQQLKSIRGMAKFVKGIANIGTFGLGSKVLDDAKAAIKALRVDPSSITKTVTTMFDDTIKGIGTLIKGTPDNPSVFTKVTNSFIKTIDGVKDTFATTKASITGSTAFKSITTFADDIKDSIAKTFKPFKDSIMGIFGEAKSAGPAGAGGAQSGGALSKIIAPLRAIGRFIGKLFLPLTIILGVFDGYKGFEEEYKDEESILDGIRGSIKGIVDGFVGTFISLIGKAFDVVLSFFGLDKTGELIGGEEGIMEDVRAGLKESVGGIVDIITGIFSFDKKRIKDGLKALMGTFDWVSDVLFAPIDLAVAFIQDIFGIGDENDEPFRFKDFLFGKDGLIAKAIAWIEDIFKIDFSAIGTKLFDMGKMLKALVIASGSYTATYLNPFTKGDNAEAAADAYAKKYNEIMGTGNTTNIEGDQISGDTDSSQKKTETLNEGSTTDHGDTFIYTDNSSKSSSSQNYKKDETYTGKLETGTDYYYQREAFGWNVG